VPPRRFFGLVEDDINLNVDPNSITYGEKRGVPFLPIGIYDYDWRLITPPTDEKRFYGGCCQIHSVDGLPHTLRSARACTSSSRTTGQPGLQRGLHHRPGRAYIWPGKMTRRTRPLTRSTLVCSVQLDTPQIFATSDVYSTGGGAMNIASTGTRFGTDPTDPPTVTLDDRRHHRSGDPGGCDLDSGR
jgi:hypothetical protein